MMLVERSYPGGGTALGFGKRCMDNRDKAGSRTAEKISGRKTVLESVALPPRLRPLHSPRCASTYSITRIALVVPPRQFVHWESDMLPSGRAGSGTKRGRRNAG